MQLPCGQLLERNCGTPQGGVISPVLSNLFLHYVFDKWMQLNHSGKPWCRYADDGLVHCKTEVEAQQLLCALQQRFEECGLELHPVKTKIVYCKDGRRQSEYINTSFDFLGYTFRRRVCKSRKYDTLFVGFTPAVSNTALKSMRAKTKQLNWRNRTEISLNDIAKRYNRVLQGWLNYYGKYNRSSLYSVWRHFNKTLVAWAMHKYKSFRGHKTRAMNFLLRIAEKQPNLFVHWREGMVGAFA